MFALTLQRPADEKESGGDATMMVAKNTSGRCARRGASRGVRNGSCRGVFGARHDVVGALRRLGGVGARRSDRKRRRPTQGGDGDQLQSDVSRAVPGDAALEPACSGGGNKRAQRRRAVVSANGRLFKSALHGWGRVMLVVNVSAAAADYDETAHVLKYAATAAQISTAARAPT